MRPRTAHRQDRNHKEIREAFRDRGFSVQDTHMIGQGFPDLICSRAGRTFLVEVKDGQAIPSKRALTSDEVDFHREWDGYIYVVESVADVIEIEANSAASELAESS